MCALKSIFKELPAFLNSLFHVGLVPKGPYPPVLSLLNLAPLKVNGVFPMRLGRCFFAVCGLDSFVFHFLHFSLFHSLPAACDLCISWSCSQDTFYLHVLRQFILLLRIEAGSSHFLRQVIYLNISSTTSSWMAQQSFREGRKKKSHSFAVLPMDNNCKPEKPTH